MHNTLPARLFTLVSLMVLLGVVGWSLWNQRQHDAEHRGFAVGNGRLEARELDVAAKFAGKLATVTAWEGDDVKAGQELARLDTPEWEAQLLAAHAALQAATDAMHAASEQVQLRRIEVGFAKRDLERVQGLADRKLASQQLLDQNHTAWQKATREHKTAQEALQKTLAEIAGAQAHIAEIRSRLKDSSLTAPRDARVLYRLAEPGEVVKEGGKVLTLADLADVYMIVYLSEQETGRIAIGSPAQIRLDAWPDRSLPGRVTFVSPQAQFTPKQVETATERQKLVFRVKVQLDATTAPQAWIKPGLPGVVFIRLDPALPWPAT